MADTILGSGSDCVAYRTGNLEVEPLRAKIAATTFDDLARVLSYHIVYSDGYEHDLDPKYVQGPMPGKRVDWTLEAVATWVGPQNS